MPSELSTPEGLADHLRHLSTPEGLADHLRLTQPRNTALPSTPIKNRLPASPLQRASKQTCHLFLLPRNKSLCSSRDPSKALPQFLVWPLANAC